MRPKTEKFSDSLLRLFSEKDYGADQKSLERSNLEVATRFYRALGKRELSTARALLCDHVKHRIFGPEDSELSGADRGPEATLEHMVSVFSLLEGQTPQALRVVAQGDLATVFYRDTGSIKATGEPYDVHGVHLLEFENGKITSLENLFDTASMERAMKAVSV